MIRGKDVVWVVWEGRGMKGRLKVGFQTTFWYLCSSWAKPTLRVVWLQLGGSPDGIFVCRHSRASGNPFWNFGNCFLNICFLGFPIDSRLSGNDGCWR